MIMAGHIPALFGVPCPPMGGRQGRGDRGILVNDLAVAGADSVLREGPMGQGGDLTEDKQDGHPPSHAPSQICPHSSKIPAASPLVNPGISRYAKAMTPSRFRELVEKALGELPEQFQTHVRNVQVTVKAAPGAEADGQPDADTLLGLYVGDPLTQQSATEPPLFPARIFIYRDSILQESGEDERLIVEEIRITVLHEIGHHLGLDDEEMAILEEE